MFVLYFLIKLQRSSCDELLRYVIHGTATTDHAVRSPFWILPGLQEADPIVRWQSLLTKITTVDSKTVIFKAIVHLEEFIFRRRKNFCSLDYS